MTLFEIFTEYRSGNTAVIDEIMDCRGKLTNTDLAGMAKTLIIDISITPI